MSFKKLKAFIAHQQEWLDKSNDNEWFIDAHDALIDAICEDLEDGSYLYSVRWHQTENMIEDVEIAYECLDREGNEDTVYFNASWIFLASDEKIIGKNPLELKNIILELQSLLNQLFPFLNKLFEVELNISKDRIIENFAWNDYQVY